MRTTSHIACDAAVKKTARASGIGLLLQARESRVKQRWMLAKYRASTNRRHFFGAQEAARPGQLDAYAESAWLSSRVGNMTPS
jgi:hypothetical protein